LSWLSTTVASSATTAAAGREVSTTAGSVTAATATEGSHRVSLGTPWFTHHLRRVRIYTLVPY